MFKPLQKLHFCLSPHPSLSFSYHVFLLVQNTCRMLPESTTTTAVPQSRVMVQDLRKAIGKAAPSTRPLYCICTQTHRCIHPNLYPARPQVSPDQPANVVSTLPNSLLNQKSTPSRQQNRKLKHPILAFLCPCLSPWNSSGFSTGEGLKASLLLGNEGQVS